MAWTATPNNRLCPISGEFAASRTHEQSGYRTLSGMQCKLRRVTEGMVAPHRRSPTLIAQKRGELLWRERTEHPILAARQIGPQPGANHLNPGWSARRWLNGDGQGRHLGSRSRRGARVFAWPTA